MTQVTPQKTGRDSNIELLRLLLMLMIVAYHFISHGANLAGPQADFSIVSNSSVAYIFLKSVLVLSVNCFVFISGYYGIKFKAATMLSLLLQASFYALGITVICDIMGIGYIGVRSYLEAIFPIFAGTWWFITAYFALYLISPLLNGAIGAFSQKQFLFVLIVLTIINSLFGFLFNSKALSTNYGYSLISFIHIYLLAQFIRKWVTAEFLKRWAIPGFVVSALLIFLLALLSITELDQRGIIKVFAYNNPLVLASAVCFFFIFLKLQFRSSLINSISPYVLGVYLFHDHPLTRYYLIENLYIRSLHQNAFVHFLYLLLFTFLVWAAGLVIDKIRELLLAPLLKYLVEKLELHKLEGLFSMKPSRR